MNDLLESKESADSFRRINNATNSFESSSSTYLIQQFVQEEFSKESVKDKRLVMLHQFLEYQKILKQDRSNSISDHKRKTSNLMHVCVFLFVDILFIYV